MFFKRHRRHHIETVIAEDIETMGKIMLRIIKSKEHMGWRYHDCKYSTVARNRGNGRSDLIVYSVVIVFVEI